MVERPIITADDLESIGAIEHASSSSQAFLEFYTDIENGNIVASQQISGLNTATFVSGYINQVEDENFTAEEALAVFLADDYAAIKRIAAADEATQQAFVDVVVYLNSHFHGLSATLAETSPDARAIFEAHGYDFTQFPTLQDPDALTIEDPSFAESAYRRYQQLFEEDQEFLASHAQRLHEGYAIMGIDMNIFRQMLVYDDFKFIRDAIARNDEDTNEIMLEVLELVDDRHEGFIPLLRERSPEIDRFFRMMYEEAPQVMAEMPVLAGQPEPEEAPVIVTTPDPVITPADPPPALSVPENVIAPELDETITTPPPPPGASVLEGLIRPQITPRAVLPIRDVKASVAEIYETLNNLPDDIEERQRILNGIADDLGELAVGLRPDVAGDPRLHRLPPVPSAPNSYDENLHRLNSHLNDVMVTYNISNITEYLIQASQTARVASRSLEAAREAEMEAEAEAARIAAIDAAPDLGDAAPADETIVEPAAPPPADGGDVRDEGEPEVHIASPDYSAVVLPESRDPHNAATYGIVNPDIDPGAGAETRGPDGAILDDGASPPAHDADGDGVPDWIGEAPAEGGADPDLVEGEPLPDPATEDVLEDDASPPAADANGDGVPDWIGRAPEGGAELERADEAPAGPSTADLLRDNAENITATRLSELLDGHGYHNDRDGFTDFDAMQGAFNRAAELGITSSHIDAIRQTLNSPDFILKTSAAIDALSAYNTGMEANGEMAALMAFFDTLSMDDFVRDRAGVRDDNSTYDAGERATVRDETLRIERDIIPRL